MKFQHVVMSTNQLMIIDGQPTHQVIVNQSPVTYEQDPTAGLLTIPQQQPPTLFYMDNAVNMPAELAQVETVELQPIVLNHRLGSQISLVQRPAKVATPQLSVMQQVQRVNASKIPRPQINQMNSPINQSMQVSSQEHQNSQFIRTVPQQKPQEVIEQPAITIEKASQISRQQQSNQPPNQFQRDINLQQVPQQNTPTNQFQRMVMDQINESDKQEAVSLGDGKVVTLAEYKELLIKQQQQRLNMMPEVSVRKRPPNATLANRPKPNTPILQNRPRPRPPIRQGETVDQSKFVRQQSSPMQVPQNPQQVKRMSPPAVPRRRTIYMPDNVDKIAETPPPPKPVPPPQQPQRQNNHNYLIQPPNQHTPKSLQPCSLPSCVPQNQIKKIIENTPISEEYSDSIRMLVMLANGEQRLITFTLPNQACTIQEILEQVGVPLMADTPVEVTQTNSNGINYIVSVGFVYQNEESSESHEGGCQIVPVVDAQGRTTLLSQSPVQREPSPEPTKEIEQPKYIEGKMAVCGYCGILSDDFNKCMRCKTKLPENVKAITAITSKKSSSNYSVHKKIEATNGTKECKKKQVVRGRNSENETVVLTLSSDEEEENDKSSGPINENILQKLGSAITLSPIKKEPSVSDIQKMGACDNDKKIYPENLKSVFLQCRTVRIGSYRTIPKENVTIDFACVCIKVPSLANPKEIVTITIERHDIVKVLISFQKQLPVFFYYLRSNMGNSIRELLGMGENDATTYDPLSENEPHRRITLLPEYISEEAKLIITQIYRCSTPNLLDELTVKEANDILIKTCPKELTLANLQPSSGSVFKVRHLFTYPPEGRGRISINSEDYMCLGSDQFLNDVIIDFYLKFLVHNLSQEEQERVHVFSTFFYKRLTTKPAKASRKNQPTELDPNLTPAEKRHARVKTWTKNIDLFKKDYVIVPINENCHWFLAIICFPGIEGCQTLEGQPIKIEISPKKKKTTTTKTTIGSVTITPMKKEEIPCEDLESDKDEAEGDESELESDDAEETQTVTSHTNRPPIKQPCILIFDSLAGTGRSRVVATLRDYLTCEYKTKYNKEKIFNKDVIKGACPKVPQQTNFTDCGLYLLQYVEHFFMEPIKDYYLPINSLKNWFDEITVTRKREDISILIKTLMMEYNKDLGLIPEIMFPTKNGVVVDQFGDEEEMEEDMSENEEFHTPPGESETDLDQSAQDDESGNLENSPEKTSETVSDKNDITDPTLGNTESVKPELCELASPKPQSNRDTLSYLKAKRIIRHKNLESPSKRMKSSE